MKTKIVGLIITLMMMVITGCGSESSAVLTALKLDENKANVVQNETFTFPAAKAVYDNGEEKSVKVTWNTTIDTSKVGATVYTASYSENGITATATFTLTVTSEKKLVNITLGKTEETINSGVIYALPATATATYDDGTTKAVSVIWDKSVDTIKIGTTLYIAIYTENGISKTATFNLTVKAPANLVSITLEKSNAKTAQETITTYKLPATATAKYDDETTNEVFIIWNAVADTTVAGTFNYHATYTENGITKTATFTLIVEIGFINKVKSLAFQPDTITVEKNEIVKLPTKAVATYDNGTTKNVTVTWITTETVDTTTVGTKYNVATFTESYIDGDSATVNANFIVEVKIGTPKLTGITLGTKSATVELNKNYGLPATATASYDDGSTKTVSLTWNAQVDTTKTGTFNYIALYTENNITKTDIFTLTVTNSVAAFMIMTTEATVNAGDIYSLPTTGTIIYTDATSEVVNIVWNTQVNTTIEGTTVYVGSCPSKTDKTVQFTLTVIAVKKSVLQIADVSATAVGESVDVVMTASDFSKKALTAEIKLNYDSSALEFTGATLIGDLSTAIKNVNASSGTVTLNANMSNGTVLSGQIVKFTFKTLKSGETQIKIGGANVIDSTGVAYIQTDITDIATVKVGSGTVTNKIEISDVVGVTDNEVELKVSGVGFETNAMGIDVILNYDSKYLDVARDGSGNIESSIVSIVNSGFADTLMIVKEISAGKVQVAIITMNGSKVNLNGEIFKIKLKTKSSTAVTTVSLGEVTVADTVSTYISNINAADTATVTINQGISTTPTFKISDETALASSYMNVKLTAENFTTAVGGVEFIVEYDSSYLSIESEGDVTFTNALAGSMKIVAITQGKVVIAAAMGNDAILNGEVVNIKFKATSKTGTTKVVMAKVSTAIADSSKTTLITTTDVGNITIN